MIGDKYELTDKEIGRGTFSVVVEARVKATNEKVVVKIIKGGGTGTRNRRAVEKEVGLLKSLVHPCIPSVIDHFESPDEDVGIVNGCIVENFIDGQTLKSIMLKNTQSRPLECIPLPGVIHLTRSLISVLDYVHSRNIVHRDIKPANILISAEGKMFLLDFGLGRLIDSVSQSTLQGAVVGTELYAAPEILAGTLRGSMGESYLSGADVWSIGAVIIQAICGVTFFDDVLFESSYYDDYDQLKTGDKNGVPWNSVLARLLHLHRQHYPNLLPPRNLHRAG